MLSVHDALERVMATVVPTPTESVELAHAQGRVLRDTVTAGSAVPPWSNSAMDGFAIAVDVDAGASTPNSCLSTLNSEAGGAWMDVVGTAAAGHPFTGTVRQGQAVKIMTGAPVPEGLNAVVMSEHTTEVGSRVQIHRPPSVGQNIRMRAEVANVGDCIAPSGATLTPALAGACASVGRAQLAVARQPRVGLISTGDELRSPGTPLAHGQIFGSNGITLAGWVRKAGGIPVDCGQANDTATDIVAAFRRAASCDAVVTTGGVSVGDFDYVTDAFAQLGATVEFWKVAIKPGKPLALGRHNNRPLFGLPGNPVSAQITFLQFVWPWIRASMGCVAPYLPTVNARTDFSYRKKAGRMEFVRVVIEYRPEGLWVRSTGDQGSGNPLSMAAADGLMVVSAETETVHAGEAVRVQLLKTTAGSAAGAMAL